MLPFTGGKGLPAEGREGVRTPPRPEGRGGREVVAAVLSAPMHRQGGERDCQSNLIMGGKITLSHLNQKKICHLFLYIYSPNILFSVT